MLSTQTMIKQLNDTVQFNCHIADANHAGDYTLCIYLLKMREFYRWEQNASLSSTLSNEQVGLWLRNRESLWESVEENDFKPIMIDNENYDPFSTNAVNSKIMKHELVYSAGYGLNNRPHFFLADLERYELHYGYELYIAGKEHARDMSAPPAMSVDNKIYIRKESFRRLLWEKLETWRWNRPDNALGKAFACYECDTDLEGALDAMTETEIDNVIYHEIGEIEAGNRLGAAWKELLFQLPHSKLSLYLRAVRDMLADHISTLPALLKQQHPPSIHFYFSNLTNLRKELSPQLMQAYQNWVKTGSYSLLESQISSGITHWEKICDEILALSEKSDTDVQTRMLKLIDQNRL